TLIAFAIITSGTRGIWVAMIFPVAATMILIYKFKARLLGALPLLSYTIIIILFLISPWITASFNWVRAVAQDDNILRRVASVYDLREASNVGRLEIWQESLKFSLRNPVGTGYGNFITSIVEVKEGASFEEVSNDVNLYYNLPQKFVTAHSLYLHILVEIGILGIILFAIFWWSVAKQIWQALVEAEFVYNSLNLFFVSIAIVLLWLLAYGLFDVTILNERVLLYLMIILALLNMALRNRPKTLF
ncbi:MAG TPA: O-antigen ligase family protein, partial [Candidatus Doudnabacteria bacterium]|nr:O-antigen ligase family protein [Candidatus Doudnabacteria bacterium]